LVIRHSFVIGHSLLVIPAVREIATETDYAGTGETVNGKRYLVVTADDYGIGAETSRGILELGVQGRVTATVLLVNAPDAEPAVRVWQHAGRPVQLGWHPCLTLDRPIAPPERVPSLIRPDGTFWPLGSFMKRVFFGRISAAEIECELRAQYQRFVELVGQPPSVVNSHHHVQVFPPVGAILLEVLGGRRRPPYLRRVREPIGMLAKIPGARAKRTFLSLLGRRDARLQERAGYPGNDWLAGVTDPPHVADPDFLVRWLTNIPGDVVELTCHPGYHDMSLVGRDCIEGDGQLGRRVCELKLLRDDRFLEACRRVGLTLVAPADLEYLPSRRREAA
jgi:predicted glycoside hydrolase/deacetylase ChbG (UPF0249 family)